MEKNKWIWMPHAGHFIAGSKCRFRLNTYVGGYIVSTVGEYLPDSSTVREILAEGRGIKLEGRGDERQNSWMQQAGLEEVGSGRKYETMVFRARKSNYKCCPYEMVSGENLDFEGYNTPEDAFAGHYRLCRKWSKKKVNE